MLMSSLGLLRLRLQDLGLADALEVPADPLSNGIQSSRCPWDDKNTLQTCRVGP